MNICVILVKLKSIYCHPFTAIFIVFDIIVPLLLTSNLIFRWIEDCLQVEIDPITELEETMRNGVILAELAAWFTEGVVKKIFRVS